MYRLSAQKREPTSCTGEQHMDQHDTSVSARADAAGQPTAAHTFLQTLADAGVSVAFGIPGGTASPLFDALRRVSGLRYVATRHEAGAAFAAMGYARATGNPALVLTTSGPGVTNTVTAVASAQAEELPLIVVSGEVPLRAAGRGALQDGTSAGWRAHEVMRPLTRWCGSVTSTTSAVSIASKALSASTTGPVFISVPLDAGSATASAPIPVFHSSPARMPQPANPAACRELARHLARASRPLMVLGNGARKATREALHLAERLGIPVAVTAHAKGVFPERHPLYLGVLGLGQHPSVDEYLTTPPDVSLVIASGLDDLATNGWTLPLLGTTAAFQVDREPEALGRSLPFTHLVEGDAAEVLRSVSSFVLTDVTRPARAHPRFTKLRPESERSDAVPLEPPRVLRALADAFHDPIWCSDIGEHLAYALHYLEVDTPGDFHDFLGFGSMGSGVAGAIGLELALQRAHARHARRDRRVVCITGDGGFAMMLGELLTCIEQRLPIVFAVMNDGRWNMVEHGFRTVYGTTPAGFVSTLADYAAAARAMGARSARLETPADLSPARLRELASSPTLPLVLDIRFDSSRSLTPGTRASSIRHFCADPK